MGRHVEDGPKRLGKDTTTQARNLRQDITLKTERRDLMGAGVGVSGGIVGLPVGCLAYIARQQQDAGTQRQLQATNKWIAGVEIEASDIPITPNLRRETLWLVVTPRVSVTEAEAAWELEGVDVGAG